MAEPAAHPENSPDEMVEEVDRDGTVLRLVSRSEMRRDRLRHRSVFIAVVSGKGDLLVHRRSASKDIWPGWWDVAVGGVVAPGEAAGEAALRELSEELGIEDASVVHLGSAAYDDADVRLVADCFVCRHDGPFVFSDGEVSEVQWVPLDGLLEWLGTHRVLPDSVALVLPRLLG